jgi:hypothetical protein
MFQSLFRRAEVAIEHTVYQVVVRVLIAVPFLVALGFAAAALSMRLDRTYDPETSRLIMAGVFGAAGLLAALVVAMRAPKTQEAATASSVETATPAPGSDDVDKSFADADRELLFAALTSAAPIAVPHLARLVLRNLPLLTAIAAGIFVMTRPSSVQTPMAPAE